MRWKGRTSYELKYNEGSECGILMFKGMANVFYIFEIGDKYLSVLIWKMFRIILKIEIINI